MGDNRLLGGLGIVFGIVGVIMHSSKAVLVKLVYEYEVDTLELLLFRMLFSLPFYVLILFVFKNKKGKKRNHTNRLSLGLPLWILRVLFG